MSKAKSSTEVLVAAKWIIENVGWCQGMSTNRLGDKIVGVCASAAISYVQTNDSSYYGYPHLREVARKRLCQAMGTDTIPDFNDSHSTTKQMVLDAFDKAIQEK